MPIESPLPLVGWSLGGMKSAAYAARFYDDMDQLIPAIKVDETCLDEIHLTSFVMNGTI